jgi:hypothetical protein
MRDILKVYGPLLALLVAAGAVLWHLMAPPPPHDLVIAAGPEGESYAGFAERYRDILADGGLTLAVMNTSGSTENQQLLQSGKASVAFIQGGTFASDGQGDNAPTGLQALASVAFEPLWVFVRNNRPQDRQYTPPDRLSQLAGLRIAVGEEDSATRSLAVSLLAASGVGVGKARLMPIGGADAADALIANRVDAVFVVSSTVTQPMQAMIDAPNVRLMNFVQADAYHYKFPFLSSVMLPRGGVDIARDIPSRSVRLLAPVTQLVARDDINPALADAILDAARRVHRAGTLFDQPDTFPSREFLELPINAEADRYFRSGPSLARRFLPFWAASIVERALILVLPLIGLAIPVIKFAPAIYNWQISRRILKWYRHLKAIEIEAREPLTPERRHVLMTRLGAIEHQIEDVNVPSSYAQSLYDLRGHVELVRRYLEGRAAAPPIVPEPVANIAAAS